MFKNILETFTLEDMTYFRRGIMFILPQLN